jgi:uncharacterized protein YecT (DUF1311 family)
MATGEAAGGVTSAILDCAGAETARQDARLNQIYKAVMDRMPPDQQAQLRTSERDWIKSRDSTCKAAMGDEAEGTLGAVIYAQCILKQEAARIAYLASPATPAVSNTSASTPTMGACHMESCAWSKTLSHTVTAVPGGSMHVLKLLGGSTKSGDFNATHIVWNKQPHVVSVTCSKTHPSVTAFGETDTLGLNAQGSDLPNVEMSAYSIYVGECHPDAKDLDPNALAERFNYQAAVQ